MTAITTKIRSRKDKCLNNTMRPHYNTSKRRACVNNFSNEGKAVSGGTSGHLSLLCLVSTVFILLIIMLPKTVDSHPLFVDVRYDTLNYPGEVEVETADPEVIYAVNPDFLALPKVTQKFTVSRKSFVNGKRSQGLDPSYHTKRSFLNG